MEASFRNALKWPEIKHQIAGPIELKHPLIIEFDVTREEVVAAVKKMKRRKAPSIV